MLRDLTRQFVKDELLPLEKQVEHDNEFPEPIRQTLKKKAVELGLFQCTMPAEFGGGGVGTLGRVIVCEQLGQVSIAVGYAGGIVGGPRSTSGGVSDIGFATPEQQEQYFLPIIRGEKESWIALTEPNSGSGDLRSMQTRAVKQGDYYVINGTKIFVSGFDISDFGLLLAITDPSSPRNSTTCFIVENSAPGLRQGEHMEVMGRRGLKSWEIFFDNCMVPEKNILGKVGHGIDIFNADMNSVRLACSAACLGTAQRALEMARSHAWSRITFGEPLAKRQAVQHMIVSAETQIHACRLMLYHTAWEADKGEDVRSRVMAIKAVVPKIACRIIDDAIQIHGGMGYSKDLPLEMMYRDCRLYSIGDGSAEVLEWAAARKMLDI